MHQKISVFIIMNQYFYFCKFILNITFSDVNIDMSKVQHITQPKISAFRCLDKLVITIQMDITPSQISTEMAKRRKKKMQEKPISMLKTRKKESSAF